MPSIDEKLDVIASDVSEIRIVQAVQTEQLIEHMRRTALAEESIALVRSDLDPLKKAHAMWSGVGKALTVLAGAGSAVGALLKFLGHH